MSYNFNITPTKEELELLFEYNPNTGILSRKEQKRGRIREDGSCGTISYGRHGTPYLRTMIDSVQFFNSRLIWRYVTGEDPGRFQIDHIDGDSLNNKFENLRLGTQSENQCNRRMMPKNKTGIKGVAPTPAGNFIAFITKEFKRFNLGTFKTLKEAKAARQAAEMILHGEFRKLA